MYIETSVPSAYVSTRADAGSVHRRDLTRSWWTEQLPLYSPVISAAVLFELRQGVWPGKDDALRLVQPLPELDITADVRGTAERYIAERLVPAGALGDATHLAVASVHEVEFLLTWNIRHLANPNKLMHLIVVNRRLGLLTPQIVTPDMLWMESDL